MIKIAAGIVLYNPDLIRLKQNIESIYHQVGMIILVDNGSDNIDKIEEIYGNTNGIFIIKNEVNLGIAAALNQIIGKCDIEGIEWVLTLDQDSISPMNLIEEYSKHITKSRIAIITPNIKDINSNKMALNNNINKYEYVEECITSASLTNVQICKEIGYFDDRMFIDYVDFDYCTRVRLNDYKILKVNTATLIHEVGTLKEIYLFKKKIEVYNHAPIRKYYYCRNIIYYCNKYKGKINVKRSYMKLFKRFIVVLLFERNKISKIRAIMRGIKDGLIMIKC